MIPSIEHQFRDNWFAVGGDLANYFALQGAVSQFGDFLLLEDYEHLNTPTYEAAQAVLSSPPPPITAGYVLPYAPGQTVLIDPRQRTPDIYANEATPGSGLTIQQGSPNVYLLRATSGGSYTLQLYGHAADSAAAVDVLVDDQTIGTLSLGASDGASSSLHFTVSRGFHSLSLAAATADQIILPAQTGAILIQSQSGGYPVVPSAPSNLTALAGNSQVTLSWAITTTATAYNVARSTQSGGPYTHIMTVKTNSYIDTSVTNSNTYYYVVSAVNPFGTGGISPQTSSFPYASVPSAPGGPQCRLWRRRLWTHSLVAGIALASWQPVPGASGYNVYRSSPGSGSTRLTASPQSGTQYTDLSVSNGTTYSYTVTGGQRCGGKFTHHPPRLEHPSKPCARRRSWPLRIAEASSS